MKTYPTLEPAYKNIELQALINKADTLSPDDRTELWYEIVNMYPHDIKGRGYIQRSSKWQCLSHNTARILAGMFFPETHGQDEDEGDADVYVSLVQTMFHWLDEWLISNTIRHIPGLKGS